ncbi:MAG: hypothetical protein PUD55_04840, partial [Firmicutes bacterium]|nr:hypothetical protein [Bacillota bacterium]
MYKKLLARVMIVCIFVTYMPSIAFAADGEVTDDSNSQIEMEIESGSTGGDLTQANTPETDPEPAPAPRSASAELGPIMIGSQSYDTLASAVAAAAIDDTITINAAGTYTLPDVPKNITIKGTVDGVVFSHTGTGNIANIPNGATFENVSFIFGNSKYHGFQHVGTINMKNCKFDGLFYSYGDMNFTDCTFKQTTEEYIMWAYGGDLTYKNCVFDFKGKCINAYNEAGTELNKLLFEDCTFKSSVSNEAAVNVKETCGSKALLYDVVMKNCTTEGQFPAPSKSDALEVISALVQVDDKLSAPTENGGEIKVTVDETLVYSTPKAVAKQYVAQVGETKYESLEAAVAEAQAGDTVELLVNASGNGIKLNKDITIDFGGNTYTVDGTTVGSTGTETQAFQLLKDNTVVFKDGTITSAKAKMLVQNYSNLTLVNMVLDGSQLADSNPYTLSTNNGQTVIKDTKIVAKEGMIAFDVCSFGSYEANKVTVEGSSVIEGKVELSSENEAVEELVIKSGDFSKAALVMADGGNRVAVSKASGVELEAPADYKWVAEGDMQKLVAKQYVAQVGDTKYESLADAVEAATIGTITLLKDAEGDGIFVAAADAKNITIDLNGNTYKVTGKAVGSTGTVSQGFHLEAGNTVTIKNGTITSDTAEVKMLIQNYCNLTLTDVAVDGSALAG